MHMSSPFPPVQHYRAALAWGTQASKPDSIRSPRECYAHNLKKIYFSPQSVLFSHLREELASRRVGRFYSGIEALIIILDRGTVLSG